MISEKRCCNTVKVHRWGKFVVHEVDSNMLDVRRNLDAGWQPIDVLPTKINECFEQDMFFTMTIAPLDLENKNNLVRS